MDLVQVRCDLLKTSKDFWGDLIIPIFCTLLNRTIVFLCQSMGNKTWQQGKKVTNCEKKKKKKLLRNMAVIYFYARSQGMGITQISTQFLKHRRENNQLLWEMVGPNIWNKTPWCCTLNFQMCLAICICSMLDEILYWDC